MTDCSHLCPPNCATQKMECLAEIGRLKSDIEQLNTDARVQAIFDNSNTKALERWHLENIRLRAEMKSLRQAMEGKVLVSVNDLAFIKMQVDLGMRSIKPPNFVSPFVALRIALDALETLHPTSSGQKD